MVAFIYSLYVLSLILLGKDYGGYDSLGEMLRYLDRVAHRHSQCLLRPTRRQGDFAECPRSNFRSQNFPLFTRDVTIQQRFNTNRFFYMNILNQ